MLTPVRISVSEVDSLIDAVAAYALPATLLELTAVIVDSVDTGVGVLDPAVPPPPPHPDNTRTEATPRAKIGFFIMFISLSGGIVHGRGPCNGLLAAIAPNAHGSRE
jgi:hypothetical protein